MQLLNEKVENDKTGAGAFKNYTSQIFFPVIESECVLNFYQNFKLPVISRVILF